MKYLLFQHFRNVQMPIHGGVNVTRKVRNGELYLHAPEFTQHPLFEH